MERGAVTATERSHLPRRRLSEPPDARDAGPAPRARHLRFGSSWLVAAALVALLPQVAAAANWESEVLAYEAQDRQNPPPPNSIVVTGSSMIRLWTTIKTDLAPLDVMPRGIGGASTDDVDYWLQRIVLVYQPRAVVIYVGDNDIEMGRTPQYVANHVSGILARISAAFPSARVYLISLKPSPARWSMWSIAQQANQLLVALAASDARYTFINVAPALLGTNGMPKPEFYVSDGLHFTAAGYQAWTSVIRPILIAQQSNPLPVETAAPTTPAGLSAAAQSSTRIDLRWGASSDAGSGLGGYRVFRNGQAVGTTTALTYADTGLAANTSYTYTVSAYDRVTPNRNESPQSAPASATTQTNPGTPPTVSLQVNPNSVASGGTTQLSWTTANATSCSASAGWFGSVPTSGSATSVKLFAATTFMLTCTGPGGTASDVKTVTILPPASVTLSATPTRVASGSATQLSWTSTNATSCTASGGWSGSKALNGAEASAILSAATTFTLTCSGSGGSASASASVAVDPQPPPPPPPSPTVSLTADQTSLANGSATRLAWASQNATACTASGGWSGAKATSGAEPTPALASNTTFVLACTGPGGTTSTSVSVIVATPPTPTATLSADPTSVTTNATTTLTWSSGNATTCTVSGGWSGVRPTSGSETTQALAATTTFELLCTGAGGTARSSIEIVVVPPKPVVQITAAPASVERGASARLSWSASDASSCDASGAWAGTKATNGEEQTAPLMADSSFSLSCAGTGGIAQATVTVAVGAASAAPPPADTSVTATSGGGGAFGWLDAWALLTLLLARLVRRRVRTG